MWLGSPRGYSEAGCAIPGETENWNQLLPLERTERSGPAGMTGMETESRQEASTNLTARSKSLLPPPVLQAPLGPPMCRISLGPTWQSRNVVCPDSVSHHGV